MVTRRRLRRGIVLTVSDCMPEPAHRRRTHAEATEPADDLVVTPARDRHRARRLSYTATTGRVVLREEVVTDDGVHRSPGRDAQIFSHLLRAGRRRPAAPGR